MPSDAALSLMNCVHRTLIRLSGNRIGWRLSGMPVLELTTTGRRSGEARTTMLTTPLEQDGTIVLVASRGGDDRHPAWFLNLRDNPEVTVTLGGDPPRRMLAQIADESTRAELWPQITERFPNYAGYQRRTTREIPLVLLREP